MGIKLTTAPSLLIDTFKLAETSPYGRFKVGAIIAQRKKVVSLGVNQQKTHPLQSRFASRPYLNSWLHAEIHAISMARAGDLEGADAYVARSACGSQWGNSRPCLGCSMALKHYGIKRMFYYKDGSFYKEDVS